MHNDICFGTSKTNFHSIPWYLFISCKPALIACDYEQGAPGVHTGNCVSKKEINMVLNVHRNQKDCVS